MPGKLYFYVNFNTIKRNFKGSKVKQFARPLLRDVEWMVYYNVEEARGFSGFDSDEEYTCLEEYKFAISQEEKENAIHGKRH
jgi:hypothetical protein